VGFFGFWEAVNVISGFLTGVLSMLPAEAIGAFKVQLMGDVDPGQLLLEKKSSECRFEVQRQPV
jgi:hypothetical protein